MKYMPKTKTKKTPQLSLGKKIGKVLINYFTTQFILMILVGVASWTILNALGVRYAVILGIVTGTLSIVPGFGMVVSTLAAGLVAIFDKAVFLPNAAPFFEGVIILLIFIVLNKIVDWILVPIFLGKTTKINPLIIILAVIIGTILYGPAGAVLAIPLYLIIRTVIEHFSSK